MSDPTTLRSLLGDVPKDSLSQAFDLHAKESATADSAPAVVRALLIEAGVGKLNEALDVDALECLGQAWLKLQTLRQYKDEKKHPAGQTTVVQLGQHDVKHTCDPVMELRAGGIPLPELRLTVELIARLKSVSLAVRDGHVISAAPGEASAIARLKYKSLTLKEQATPVWKLPGSISFGKGIALPG